MKRLVTIVAGLALAALAGPSIARADQIPAWWIAQQQITQQQIQQAVGAELARQQIQQATQRQIDTQSLTLAGRAAALETQRELNGLQLRYTLDSQAEDMRLIQQKQLLQILQLEVSPAVHKKAAAHKKPAVKS